MKKIPALLFCLWVVSCGKVSTCPSDMATPVNFVLYVDMPSDNPWARGYVIRKGQGAGRGGVIVVPQATGGFRAFELSAPHIGVSEKSTLQVSEDGMRLVCPADGSEFMMLNGMPLETGSTVSPCGLVEYRTAYSPTQRTVRVFN